MKKVLVITYYWPPSGGPGVQRWLKFVKYMPQFDLEPVVLTVRPEDATYPGIDHSFDKDVAEGTQVIKTRSREIFKFYKNVSGSSTLPYAGFSNKDSNTAKQKIARFIRGNFFIPDPRKGWNKIAYRSAAKLLSEDKDIDCIITTGPPQSTHLIGLALKKKYNIPWIADLRDPWTDIYYFHQLYPTKLAYWLNLRLEKLVFQKADRITTASPSFRKQFLLKHHVPEAKVRVLTNGYDEDDFDALPQPGKGPFTITHVGTLTDLNAMDAFIDVVGKMLKGNTELRLRFVGSVSENIQSKLNHFPPEVVEFIPPVNHRSAITHMAKSHLLLLVVPDHTSGQGILPGKLFEYLATGNPILGIGPVDGDPASILHETKSGVMKDYHDSAGIDDALRLFQEEFGKQEAHQTRDLHPQYSRKNLTASLVHILKQIAHTTPH
jgi:glycosyltransferase involved in cell wall biosynthesis